MDYSSSIDFNNPDVYKHTYKKKYTIKACMPPIGTKVFNRLEQVSYITTPDKSFVLTGTVGEHWVIDINKLIKTYTFVDRKPITVEALKSMTDTIVVNGIKQSTIKPFRITTIAGPINWAIRVPTNMVFKVQTAWGDILTVNAPGIPHGNGDYLVCADANGKPNLADRWVVNGEVFPSTYNMKSFPNESTYKQRRGCRT